MKMAKKLESQGKVGQVIIIDGAPKFLKILAVEHLPEHWNDDTVKNYVLTNVIMYCIPEDNGTIIKEILSIPNFEARIKKLAERQTMYTEEYGYKMCSALVNRMILTANVDLSKFEKLQTPITLIRPSEVSVIEIEEDYELGKYSSHPVKIQYVDGNHATVLENPKLPAVINNE